MSFSLISKGLELIEEDFHCSTPSKNNAKIKPDSKLKNKIKRDTKINKQSLTSLTNRKVKSAFDSYPKKKSEDNTLTNIEALSRLDEKLNSSVYLNKVKEYNLKRLAKSSSSAPLKKKVEESKSVFSEEDFEKMNDEWLSLL